MSECVVRMEMPGSCDVCPCIDDYGDYPRCRISEEQRGYNFPIREKRMPNCPIICSLPEGHGDLIDKESFIKRLYMYCGFVKQILPSEVFEFYLRILKDVEGEVNKEIAIVPAERSET